LWALLLMPLFIACDKDNDGANVDGAATVDQLIGSWSVKDDGTMPYDEKSIVLKEDGKYDIRDTWYSYSDSGVQYISEQFKTEGTYKFEGGKLKILTGETLYREGDMNQGTGEYALSDWEPLSEEDGGKFEPGELAVSLKLGGSLLLLSEEGDPNQVFFIKEGAKLSSDKSALKGTWIASDVFNNKTYAYAVKFDADSLDYVDSYWGDRYISGYDFKEGYITPTTCVYWGWDFEADDDEFNMADPYANTWVLSDDEYYINPFPFIVDGKTAYAWIASEFLTFKKK